MRFALILAVLVLVSRSALATDYYIRAGGSDSNDGLTPQTAFASLEHFDDLAQPGDTVYIGAGTYNEQVRFTNPGTPTQPVRIIGDQLGQHTGDAGQVILTSGTNSQVMQLTGASYHEISGLHFDGGQEAVRIDAALGIVIDGCSFEGSLEKEIGVQNNGSVHITNCTISGQKLGLQVTNGSATIVDSNMLDLTNALEITNVGSSIDARRVDIRRVTRGAYSTNGTLTLINVLIHDASAQGVYTRNQTVLTMVHCTVDTTEDEGARFRGTATLYNNIFSNINSHCMRLDRGRVTASHNLVFKRRGDRSNRFNSLEFEFDPLYTDAENGNFTLLPESEAREIGFDASSYTSFDLAGNDRPAAAGFDLGAYEGSPPPVLYVRAGGDDSNNGLSPQSALRTVASAITRCTQAGSTVHVGPGTYAESLQIGTGNDANAVSGTQDLPTRLIADISGVHTLDDPGPVILDGGGTRANGIEISNVDHWSFENWIIQGFTSYGIRSSGSGFSLIDSEIDVPSSYAIYASIDSDFTVRGCRFIRSADSGHVCWVEPASGANGMSVEFVGNDATMRDALYLSTGMNNTWTWSQRTYTSYRYGVIVYGYRGRFGPIEVSNNQISDSYLPIYVYSRNGSDDVRIVNNTVVGSLYSIYAYAQGGDAAVSINNNIIDQCYYGLFATVRGGPSMSVAGLLEHQITYPMSGYGRPYEFDIITSDPQFYDPEGGDFSLWSVSDAVDAGTSNASPGTDIDGVSRPSDGDGDGIASVDLGAYEQVHEGGQQRVRVVQWREIGADRDR